MITANEDAVAEKLEHYGGLFIGSHAAEVLGDYGAGPNHTLPTVRPVRSSHFRHCPLTLTLTFVCSQGGTARYTGGLSVFNFLRIRTWLKIDHPEKYACSGVLYAIALFSWLVASAYCAL